MYLSTTYMNSCRNAFIIAKPSGKRKLCLSTKEVPTKKMWHCKNNYSTIQQPKVMNHMLHCGEV